MQKLDGDRLECPGKASEVYHPVHTLGMVDDNDTVSCRHMHTDTMSCRHTEAHADKPTFIGVCASAKGCSAGGSLVAYSCTDANKIHTERIWQVAGNDNKLMRHTSCSLVDHFCGRWRGGDL